MFCIVINVMQTCNRSIFLKIQYLVAMTVTVQYLKHKLSSLNYTQKQMSFVVRAVIWNPVACLHEPPEVEFEHKTCHLISIQWLSAVSLNLYFKDLSILTKFHPSYLRCHYSHNCKRCKTNLLQWLFGTLILSPFYPREWPASYFSFQYLPWIKH